MKTRGKTILFAIIIYKRIDMTLKKGIVKKFLSVKMWKKSFEQKKVINLNKKREIK